MTKQVAGKLASKSVEFVAPGLRKARLVRHFIYFRQTDEAVTVARVLHDAMEETIHVSDA